MSEKNNSTLKKRNQLYLALCQKKIYFRRPILKPVKQ